MLNENNTRTIKLLEEQLNHERNNNIRLMDEIFRQKITVQANIEDLVPFGGFKSLRTKILEAEEESERNFREQENRNVNE